MKTSAKCHWLCLCFFYIIVACITYILSMPGKVEDTNSPNAHPSKPPLIHLTSSEESLALDNADDSPKVSELESVKQLDLERKFRRQNSIVEKSKIK
ncbi:hypothetical protein HMI55_005568, partial [Coelomomyces lativittatus]